MKVVEESQVTNLKGWQAVSLSELGELFCGQSPDSSTVNTNGDGTVYVTGPEQWNGNEIISNKWTTEPKRIAPDNSIFVTVKGSVGEMFRGDSCAIGRDIYAFKPSGLLNFDYVFFAIQEGINEIVMFAKGDIPGISKSNILDHKIYLPNRKTQDLVVTKIEELFSELDKGVESLKTARDQLKVYRQALLKHAFEGKLTEQWRKENADKLETAEQLLERIKQEREARYQQQLEEWTVAIEKWESDGKIGKRPIKPVKPKQIKPIQKDIQKTLTELDDGWVWEKLGYMTTGVEYGTSAKSKKTGSHPVLRMGNIQNAKFDWSDLVYTSDEDEIGKYLLKKGDVLFNRTNSPELVGKTAIYIESRPAVFAGYLIRINQINSIVLSQYLNLFLNSHVARQYGNIVKTDGVNQSNINGEKLINYPFPYCSILEQQKIVEILDEKLSVIDVSLDNIEDNIARAEALRQSILKKAFSGQLVPQDPNDEPASVLLERIAREKAEAAATPRKSRAAKAAPNV
ncbi:MAG: restriction endonuclease [Chlorobiaceae bacterium]|nr:restriction endonuclease [Chlorobiaceae bacterium]